MNMYDKSVNMYIWAILVLNELFTRDSYTQIRFSKKMKQLVANIHSLWWVHFALPIQFVLILAFVLTFSFASYCFELKSDPPVFFRKGLVFQKTFFKVKILKTFKISCDCHIKPCLSLKRRAFFKNPKNLVLEEHKVFLLASE